MDALRDALVRFGQFELDLLRRQLRLRHGAHVAVSPRALDVLAALVARAGETVDRRTLVEAAWPGRVVEDNNLNQAIAALRRVFGTHGGEHEAVVTVPGRGYRFVMPVWTERSGARFALAVLPFDVAADPELDASLGHALAEALVVALAPRLGAPVRSLAAAETLPAVRDAAAIGRRLAATHVVEGSVRRHDDVVRISLRLIDASTGIASWSRIVDTTAAGVWRVHDRLAARIATAVHRAIPATPERRAARANAAGA